MPAARGSAELCSTTEASTNLRHCFTHVSEQKPLQRQKQSAGKPSDATLTTPGTAKKSEEAGVLQVASSGLQRQLDESWQLADRPIKCLVPFLLAGEALLTVLLLNRAVSTPMKVYTARHE